MTRGEEMAGMTAMGLVSPAPMSVHIDPHITLAVVTGQALDEGKARTDTARFDFVSAMRPFLDILATATFTDDEIASIYTLISSDERIRLPRLKPWTDLSERGVAVVDVMIDKLVEYARDNLRKLKVWRAQPEARGLDPTVEAAFVVPKLCEALARAKMSEGELAYVLAGLQQLMGLIPTDVAWRLYVAGTYAFLRQGKAAA